MLLVPRFCKMTHEEALDGELCVQYDYSHFSKRLIAVNIPFCMPHQMTEALLSSLDKDWPIFVWRSTERWKKPQSAQTRLDCYIFVVLLIKSVLRFLVESAKDIMGSLAYLQQDVDDQEHFTKLTRFRRTLGQLHHAIIVVQRSPVGVQQILTGGAVLSQPMSPTQDMGTAMAVSTEATLQLSLETFLSNGLSELQTALDAVKADLNEEIRVAVGAVQVRDAQATKTQTNMTVVLTILAALYLPMTLVTGIFGMNVEEISRPAGNPKAWWVAVVWLVIVVLTIGCGLLVWKVWKAWTARKARNKESDIEGGPQNEEAIEDLGRRTDYWGRKLKQKAKMITRHKDE